MQNIIDVQGLKKEFKSFSSRSGLKGRFVIFLHETIRLRQQ